MLHKKQGVLKFLSQQDLVRGTLNNIEIIVFGGWLEAYPDFIAKNVNEAVKWILENSSEE
ncbi:hypothetical protein [Paenibacillus solani]|uniref:Uncharacterized protein n=1 Tax=Paenibacillus solani TaxID=1705565 RepID=A0A0M1P5N0_9BACL|nr:hypothetical protein [Paenibacillus solani]KOR89712.1 hypothetical protein AM231_11605 [Paenibacillus solani]